MDHFKSQSCPKTFSNSEHKKHSSNEGDGEVFSLSEMNLLEKFLGRLDEMPDNFDLCANDDVGNICLESQQHRFAEYEQGTSQLTENNATVSNMNTSNENAASNLAPDSRFILLQQGNPLSICPSSCLFGVPQYFSDDKEEEIGNFSTTLESVVSECDIIKSNIYGYTETFQSTLHEENEDRSSNPITAKSSVEYRAAIDVSNRDALYDTDVCMPESYESSEKGTFLNHTNNPLAADYTGNCGFSCGQRDVDEVGVLQNEEEQQNIVLPGEVSTDSDNRSSEFCNSGELLVPVNNKCTVISPSITNAEVQWHLDDGRFICSRCRKGFGKKHHLLRHYRTHTGEKPFACDKCEKGFGRKDYLVTHYRTHTGEKPFACDKCEKTFGKSNDLVRHRRSHTGEKLYKCSVCGKAFARSSGRNYHYRNVHNKK
ncbi:Zinc finger protein 354C [Araneus ventricosus]|uniref:Zinc finger protein 354C n=1 Tax=Araneus ventricosus TaxID=182803 RepID=A0A4Y2U523_ARAVE|nr:Zinc finger protein 354C [Araneus ventricosus]